MPYTHNYRRIAFLLASMSLPSSGGPPLEKKHGEIQSGSAQAPRQEA
jgi:hypothetical protein